MRSTRRTIALMLLGGLTATHVGCTANPRMPPHRGLTPLWRDYVAMPPERALAIAGDPDRAWVGAASGGFPTREIAEEEVIAACMVRRAARRMQEPCRLYASGDEIVW